MPAVMNAANEVAVKAFLAKKIKFDSIPKIISKVMSVHKVKRDTVIKDILAADSEAREQAETIIQALSSKL